MQIADQFSFKRGSKVFKGLLCTFMAAILIVSGFFITNSVLADAIVIPTSNGMNISIDTTSAGGSGIFTSLNGINITEDIAGDINTGIHIINLPDGWEFDTTSDILIATASDIAIESNIVTPDLTSFSFEVISQSTFDGALTFNGLKVRPTSTTLPAGNIIHSGADIVGVDGETNFGTLSTVAGTVSRLAFTTQPGDAEYGSFLDGQPVVKTQDQFGNDSINGLDENLDVTLALTDIGMGNLIGETTLDIGNGIAEFADLTVDEVGIKKLTASAGDFSIESEEFEITTKPLIATVTVDDKNYNDNDSAKIIDVTLNGIVEWNDIEDDVEVDFSGATAIFDGVNVGKGIGVTATGVIIDGVDVGNYDFNNTAIGTADINQLEITITPNTEQTKIYGEADDLTYTFEPNLIVSDEFTGSLGYEGEGNVGTYAYNLGDLSAGPNYNLVLASGIDEFTIAQRPITVIATGIDKEYNGDTNAAVTLSSEDEVENDEAGKDGLLYSYTSATFLDKTAENGKTVTVSGISISGVKVGNYNLLNTIATTEANIAKKEITLTINIQDKTYDGDRSATYSENPRVLNEIIVTDNVFANNDGTKAFEDKNAGEDKQVTATGVTLGGTDKDNYYFDGVGTGTATINKRPITVTAVPVIGETGGEIYDGTTTSQGSPIIANTGNLTSGPIVGDDVENFIQTYDDRNVGGNKTLTPEGSVNDGNSGNNYAVAFNLVLTGVITQKTINVIAKHDEKPYDGTIDSDEDPTVDELVTGVGESGVKDSIKTYPIQKFDTKDVGTGKILTPSELEIDDGNGGNNYIINYIDDITGKIIAKELTVTGATTISKPYDGNRNATVDFTNAKLVSAVEIEGEEGIISPDVVTLKFGEYSAFDYPALFDNKDVNQNVNIGKEVIVSGLTLDDGDDAKNYSLVQPVLNDGEITVRTLTVTAIGINKVYDGTIKANVTLSSEDKVEDDGLEYGRTATFDDSEEGKNDGKDVGNGKQISVTDIEIISGVDAGNYILGNKTTTTTANITEAPLTAIITVENKDYDGNDKAEITAIDNLEEVFGNDIVTAGFSEATATFNGINVGTYNISVKGTVELTGTDALNYTLANEDITGTGEIVQRPIKITAVEDSKTYDGDISSKGIPVLTEDSLPLAFDDIAIFAQTFVDEDVDVNKTLIPNVVSIKNTTDEDMSGNYSVTPVDIDIGVINKKSIDIIPCPGQSKIYGEDDPDFTFKNNPDLISTDEFTGALGRENDEIEIVGFYAYTIGTLTAGDNYSLTLDGTEMFEIKKATPIITWNDPDSIVYGTPLSDTQLNAEANIEGEFVYNPTLGTVLDVGTRPLAVIFTPTDDINYNNASEEVIIVVEPASLKVTADNKVKGANTDDPKFTYKVDGLVNEDTEENVLSGELARQPEGEDTSIEYEIIQGGLISNDNYYIIYNPGVLTIKNAPTVISHSPSSIANVADHDIITITFSEPVVVEAGDIVLSPDADVTISGSETDTIILTPTSVWNNNSEYVVTVTTGVTDMSTDSPVSMEAKYSWAFTAITSYNLELNADAGGWNLISLPVTPANKNISAVLGDVESSIESVWTYDPTNPNADSNGGWLVYNPGETNVDINNLDVMTAGYGYWVNTTADVNIIGSGSLMTAGPITPPSRNLVSGWNLVGYYQIPGEESSNVSSVFRSLGGAEEMQGLLGFDNSTGKFDWTVETILPGDAFWVALPDAKVYTPSNL